MTYVQRCYLITISSYGRIKCDNYVSILLLHSKGWIWPVSFTFCLGSKEHTCCQWKRFWCSAVSTHLSLLWSEFETTPRGCIVKLTPGFIHSLMLLLLYIPSLVKLWISSLPHGQQRSNHKKYTIIYPPQKTPSWCWKINLTRLMPPHLDWQKREGIGTGT